MEEPDLPWWSMTTQAPPGPSPRPPAARPARRTRAVVVVTTVVTAVLVAAALLALTWPRDTVAASFEQPASVAYADGSVHHLAIIDRGPSWGLPIGDGHRYELYAGRDAGNQYGHFLDLGVPDGSLDGAEVCWTADGARLVLGTGQETFVPADAFTGGR